MSLSSATQTRSDWQVRRLRPDDHDRWRGLYAGYAAFYGLTQTAEQAERTSAWLLDPAHELEGLVAHGDDMRIIGIAHVRAFARPSTATVGGYLDDLYVDHGPHAHQRLLTQTGLSRRRKVTMGRPGPL